MQEVLQLSNCSNNLSQFVFVLARVYYNSYQFINFCLKNPIADIGNTNYQKPFKTYYVVGPIHRRGLEAITYTPIYNNTFMLVPQMHRDLTLLTMISPCLRALQLHVYVT